MRARQAQRAGPIRPRPQRVNVPSVPSNGPLNRPRNVRAADGDAVLVVDQVVDLERVLAQVRVMRAAVADEVRRALLETRASAADMRSAAPGRSALIRLAGMMLPGNGALVSGSVTMRDRPKKGFDGFSSSLRSPLRIAAVGTVQVRVLSSRRRVHSSA